MANCRASLCPAVQEATKKHQEQRKELTEKAAAEIQPLCSEFEARKQGEERLEEENHILNTRIESLEQAKADDEKRFNDDLNAKQEQLDQDVKSRLLKEQELKDANADISALEGHLKMQRTGHEGLLRDANKATAARSAAVKERDKAKADLDAERELGRDRNERVEALQAEIKRHKVDVDDLTKLNTDLTTELRDRQADLRNAISQLESPDDNTAVVND